VAQVALRDMLPPIPRNPVSTLPMPASARDHARTPQTTKNGAWRVGPPPEVPAPRDSMSDEEFFARYAAERRNRIRRASPSEVRALAYRLGDGLHHLPPGQAWYCAVRLIESCAAIRCLNDFKNG
jgi:hypothetical protein